MPSKKKSPATNSNVIETNEPNHETSKNSEVKQAELQANNNQHVDKQEIQEQPAPTKVNVNTAEEDKRNNKRRGRKPKDKFNIDDAYADQNNSLLDFDNNIIIKLPIACQDLENELSLNSSSVLYNPILSEPKPFNECSENSYELLEPINNQDGKPVMPQNNVQFNMNKQSIGSSNNNNNQNEMQSNQGMNCYNTCNTQNNNAGQYSSSPPASGNYMDYYQTKLNDLLSDLDDSASKKRLTQIEILLNKKYKTAKQIDLLHNLSVTYEGTKWPQNTNICCFWDCHPFDNTPWGIPKKYNAETGIFTMSGIFCSPNCELAHLLRNEANNVNLWEQVSLLNLLHYKIYETDENIVPAPDNVCLKMFGGPLNIQEFRALTLKNEKKYSVSFPPCVIITPVLEETKKVFNQDSYFIPIDKKRINKIQTELKIKRTNNVYKNSLENVMNITYSN